MGKKINLFLLTIFFVLFSLSPLVLAVNCPVPDTGQTSCYDNDSEITCPSPSEDFYGQDAQYPCNPQSYTKLDADGNDLPDEATEWIMIRDNVTGLIWENKTDDGSIHNKDTTYDWQDAQDVFIAALNSQNFGGHSDWRLPTIKELSAIVDSSILYPGPTINTDYFPNTVASYYWSSTAYAYNPSNAWLVDFYHGSVSAHSKSYNGIYVRAVCGRQCRSLNNYVDNGDGTVTDTSTGLMWQQDTAPGTYIWQQALSYCEDITLAEHDDWRLPNRNELQSLVDYSRHGPSIDTAFFPNTLTSYYWSSTTIASTPSTTWLVIFDIGMLDDDSKSYYYNLYHVRAVRAGQCESLTTTTTTIGSTTTTTVPSCPSEQIYGEYSDETEILRYLRDNILNQTPEGQELIRLYYEWSPMIVKAIEEDEEFKQEMKKMIDGVLMLIGGER